MEKIVDFSLCQKCVHKDKKETDEPCFECLSSPTNEDSRTPIKFENKEK